ncbi:MULTISPECIES: DUF3862 domain-containing protein [unclassified Anabaena]|uniref:DUF3862 domain-containing protein n=1 Tax=unclassified Anabaena TaxID=2619674 RepID=UPI0006AC7E78|nr:MULTISPECIES: DUF3862 domain-containing protein [unclassified Anabaena]ALB39881.1 hypothetical protein AA650_04860 [Anabaena sp. WA102]NTW20280.1 DUF3862 domain-containing protein [Nostocales cyanobacterium W4_Combined_metabat2_030]OBQ17621.1 MAG: hypothetical protein AN486_14465 [Anabaena sp. AL93]
MNKISKTIKFILLSVIVSSCSILNNVATKEEFDKIKNEMSYEEVIDIMGEKPSDDNSEHWATYVPTVWIWKNMNGSEVRVSFSEGKVISKSQKGL